MGDGNPITSAEALADEIVSKLLTKEAVRRLSAMSPESRRQVFSVTASLIVVKMRKQGQLRKAGEKELSSRHPKDVCRMPQKDRGGNFGGN